MYVGKIHKIVYVKDACAENVCTRLNNINTLVHSRLYYKDDILYTWNFSRHVYFMVKHETRVEILRMKVIQKFSRFSHLATRLCTKNVCY